MENEENESECFSFKPVELLVLENRWNKETLNEYKPLVQKFINEHRKKLKTSLGLTQMTIVWREDYSSFSHKVWIT